MYLKILKSSLISENLYIICFNSEEYETLLYIFFSKIRLCFFFLAQNDLNLIWFSKVFKLAKYEAKNARQILEDSLR
jgi:hypothetical protein